MEKNNITVHVKKTAAAELKPAAPTVAPVIEITPVATRINTNAVIGVSLLNCLFVGGLFAGLIGLGTLFFSDDRYTSYEPSLFMLPFLLLVFAVLAGVPLLYNMKHGWRTVVMTYILQSLLVFMIAFALTAFTAIMNTSDDGYTYPRDRPFDITVGPSIP